MEKRDEENLLRSVALQNANIILLARQRAEQELLRAKESLEVKTRELANSLSMIRATLESTTDAILVTDTQGRITDCNEKFLTLWGVSMEFLESKSHLEVQNFIALKLKMPDVFLTKVAAIYEAWPSESFDRLEFTDGRVLERFSKIQSLNGRPVGRVWSYREITERVRSEEALREQNEWFKVTLGSIGDGVLTVDTDCLVTFLNPVAEEHTGWRMSEAVGQPLEVVMRIIKESTRCPTENPIKKALKDGIVVGLASHTTLISRNGQEIPIEDSAAPIKSLTGKIIGAVMVFQDVSERRQKESDLARIYGNEQQARGAAELANRSKDRFIAMLSHELRTPLTPVLAILSSLKEDSNLPESVMADLEVIRRNIVLETRLIDDLLDITRISSGKLQLQCEPTNIIPLIENAISICTPEMALKDLQLFREFTVDVGLVQADGIRITQVLWNLLKNSAKFTSRGGTITVRMSPMIANRTKQVAIEVIDTGIGMDKNELERIFTPFEQGGPNITKRFGGLGLGLAISKTIAELHGGTIIASSSGKGKGSTFTLTLPSIAPGDTQFKIGDPTNAAKAAAKVPARNLRVLLVEDHADTAMVLSRVLRRMGHNVIHCSNVADALAAADTEMNGAGINIVISDVGLPDGSGLELMRLLSTKFNLRGVAVSGYGMDSDIEKSRAAGFIRHLTKPIDIQVLREIIAEIADLD